MTTATKNNVKYTIAELFVISLSRIGYAGLLCMIGALLLVSLVIVFATVCCAITITLLMIIARMLYAKCALYGKADVLKSFFK